MSRVSYNEGDDEGSNLAYGRWIARENKVLKGKPAQQHFKALKAALEAMPHRRLAKDALAEHGEVCAIGAYAVHQEMQANIGCGYRTAYDAVQQRYLKAGAPFPDKYPDWISSPDQSEATEQAAKDLGINETLAWMIQDLNDGGYFGDKMAPERRWQVVYNWCCEHIREAAATVGRTGGAG